MEHSMQPFGPGAAEPAMDRNQAAIALATAMSEARAQSAEADGMRHEARGRAVARLEALRLKLAPLYAAIPRDVEMFDLGFVAHERPRIFVDIIAYVEASGEGQGLRLVQETRTARVLIAEGNEDGAIIEAVTRYIARRLVAREKALAAEAPMIEQTESQAEAEDGRTSEPVRMPARAAAMAAEEAFRRWTSAGIATKTEESVQPTKMPSAEPRPASAVVAAEEAASIAPPDPLPDQPSAQAAEQAAIPAGRIHDAMPLMPARHPIGWWIWPLAALAIGAGLGALALYLYAASLP